MSKISVFTTPSGDEMAVLPLADYQRIAALAEDNEDVRIFDQAMARLESGEDEIIPPAAVKRLKAGENPVRVWRDLRGMSARDLAAKAGVSPSYLSQIENGERDGTLKTMKSIADALGLTLDDLV